MSTRKFPKLSSNKNNIWLSNNKNIMINGSFVCNTKEGIPVLVNYENTLKRPDSEDNNSSQKIISQDRVLLEDLRQNMENCILSSYRTFISSHSIISIPEAIKRNQNILLEEITLNLLNQGIILDNISINVQTTLETKLKSQREKIYSWLLNFFIILVTISVIYILYH